MGRLSALPAALVLLLAAGCTSASKYEKALERGNLYYEKREFAKAILEYRNAMKINPSGAEGAYRLALAMGDAGDVRTAIGLLRKAVSLEPRHTEAQLKLAEVMALSADGGQVKLAENKIREVLSFAPDRPETLQLLAISEWRLGKVEDAEAHLRELLKRFPDHLQPAITLAWTRLSRNDAAGAESILKDLVERTGRSPGSVMALGRFYLVTGRVRDAMAQFQDVCAREPKNGEALLDLARTQIQSGDTAAAETTFRRLGELEDRRYRILLPVFRHQMGNNEAAIPALQALLKEDPANRTVRSLLVSALLQENRSGDASEVLEQALQRNGRDIEARLQRARIRLLKSQLPAAQEDLMQVLIYEPQSAEAHYLLSRVAAERSESQLARQELAAALEADPLLLPARVDLSRHYIATNNPNAALQVMNDVPKGLAGRTEAVAQRNWALLAAGQKKDLRQSLNQVLSTSEPEFVLQDAVLKLTEGSVAEARKGLHQVLASRPEEVRAIQALAGSWLLEDRKDKALEVVREAAAKAPESRAVQALASRWYFDLGEYAAARTACNAILAGERSALQPEIMLARIDVAEEHLEAARRRLAALAARPAVIPEVFFRLGNVEQQMGDRSSAIQRYRKAVELDGTHTGALNNLAFLLVETAGNPDEALKYAQEALRLSPGNPVVEDTLGWAYYNKGLYTIAVRHLESAVGAGGSPVARYHLASAYARAGKRDKAQKTLESALAGAPHLPEAQAARTALAQSPTP